SLRGRRHASRQRAADCGYRGDEDGARSRRAHSWKDRQANCERRAAGDRGNRAGDIGRGVGKVVVPGPRNLITDIPGLRVGNTHDERVLSGVTAVIFDKPNVASGVTLGGAPGSRDTTLLEPEMTIQSLDAVVLSGGSLFGLDAAGGVVSFLRQEGRGVRIGSANVPIAAQAIVFDLLNGGDKHWGRMPPYWELGWRAAEKASGGDFPLGTVGGGYGAS